MVYRFLFILFLIKLNVATAQNEFLNTQLNFPRVADANLQKFNTIKSLFDKKGIVFPTKDIFWRGFKFYKTLELWAYSPDSQRYVLITTYPICELVGDLGPKRQAGDFQTPEGFYNLDIFNPNSKYYLSLHVNYPNQSDRILGTATDLGGDIYIHGACETIGCIPMTDNLIKEVYLISMYAKSCGQEFIPFHIFPMRMTPKNMNKLKQDYFKYNTKLLDFWNNLKEGYDYFDKYKMVPSISVNSLNGLYIIEK